MSVFCNGCRQTADTDEFGVNNNGSQYKTCMKCRNKTHKEEPEEDIPDCCVVKLARTTFRNLNCEIVYPSELKYILELD